MQISSSSSTGHESEGKDSLFSSSMESNMHPKSKTASKARSIKRSGVRRLFRLPSTASVAGPEDSKNVLDGFIVLQGKERCLSDFVMKPRCVRFVSKKSRQKWPFDQISRHSLPRHLSFVQGTEQLSASGTHVRDDDHSSIFQMYR